MAELGPPISASIQANILKLSDQAQGFTTDFEPDIKTP
jgi:hypothetical protein